MIISLKNTLITIKLTISFIKESRQGRENFWIFRNHSTHAALARNVRLIYKTAGKELLYKFLIRKLIKQLYIDFNKMQYLILLKNLCMSI